ncbi:MAG TPA: porin, partial [Pseudomonas sp.]|nr:porin [Pseudomonas sp.]
TAVRDVLVNQYGVGGERVDAVGYGESRPVADNSTADGRAVNRRVEAAVEAEAK